MKKLILVLIISIFFFSCSKKEEEIKIKRPDENISSQVAPQTQLPQQKDTNTLSTPDTLRQKSERKPKSETYRINSRQASSYIGKSCIIKGYVADVVIREKVAYLNFEEKYPKNPVSGTIFADYFSAFGDIKKFKNKYVEMNGTISEYNGKPQIILKSANQIKITEK